MTKLLTFLDRQDWYWDPYRSTKTATPEDDVGTEDDAGHEGAQEPLPRTKGKEHAMKSTGGVLRRGGFTRSAATRTGACSDDSNVRFPDSSARCGGFRVRNKDDVRANLTTGTSDTAALRVLSSKLVQVAHLGTRSRALLVDRTREGLCWETCGAGKVEDKHKTGTEEADTSEGKTLLAMSMVWTREERGGFLILDLVG